MNYHRERFRKLHVSSVSPSSDEGLIFRQIPSSDEGLTFETLAFEIFHGGNSTFIESFGKTKFYSLLK